jgi:hypothetical protein
MTDKQPIYLIRLQGRPGVDGIRNLRATLKALLRRHQLRCIDAREEPSKAVASLRSDPRPAENERRIFTTYP